MFGRYAKPTDDVAGSATVTASDEDGAYPAANLVATSNTGHLNLPSRPAKLSETSGHWDLAFASPVSILAAALFYHNLDEGLDVTLEIGGGSPFGFSVPIPIIAPWEDGWTVSPLVTFATQSGVDAVRLSINEPNSLAVQVGRLALFTTLRQIETDVRWGVEETEEHGLIEHRTELGVETLYDLGGKRRAINGQLGYRDDEADEFISLMRTARSRIQPWFLQPDHDVPEMWIVRNEEPRWSRTRENPNFNTLPFRVREVSRGLPFP